MASHNVCATGADLSLDRSMYLDLSKHVLPKNLLVGDHHFSHESRNLSEPAHFWINSSTDLPSDIDK